MKDNIENNAYVYLHRRLDTNEVFYVGISKQLDFKRAYDKTRRSKFWKYITNKTNYAVDIIYKNISWEQACKYEINLISMYGRKDLNLGKLVNLTSGGEGNHNTIRSEEYKKKMSISCRNKIVTEETRKLLTLAGMKRYAGKKKIKTISKIKIRSKEDIIKTANSHKKLILDTQTGIFYLGAKEAAESLNIPVKRFTNYLTGYRKNKTNFIYC